MKPIKNLPSATDDRYVADVIREHDRYVADVIREHDRWRRALLVLAVLLCWQMAVEDARAIVVTGEVVS